MRRTDRVPQWGWGKIFRKKRTPKLNSSNSETKKYIKMGATGKRDVKHRVTLIKIGQNAPFRANFG